MTKSRGLRIRRGTRIEWLAENEGKHLCRCGCGDVIPLRTEHYGKVPAYRHGHNSRVNPPNPKLSPRPSQPCGCGCGVETSPGMRYLVGHNGRGKKRSPETLAKLRAARRFGPDHPLWGKRAATYKGRVILSGYVGIFVDDHPFITHKSRTGGYVLEHRLVMERHLRETDPTSPHLTTVDGCLYLRPGSEVHHRNQVKTDNRVENLQVLTRAEHAGLHMTERWAKKKG